MADTKLRLILEALWKGKGVQQANKDLNALHKTAGKGAGSMKSAGIVAGIMGGIMATVSSKVMQLAGAMKDQIADSIMLAARYETMGIVVDNLGKNIGVSTSQMRLQEKALQDTGISMIGSREAIGKLIAAEIDLAHATDLARVAQDGAVIANTNSTDAYQRLIQFISTGNVRVARSMNLFIDLAAGYEAFAEANDRTVESLTELEKAQIRANLAIEAGETIAGTYEAAMQTVGKQLGSLTGRELPDLKTALGAIAQGPLFDMIVLTRKVVGQITDQIVVEGELTSLLENGTITMEEYNWALSLLYDKTEIAAEAIEFAATKTEEWAAQMAEHNAVVDGWAVALGLLNTELDETGAKTEEASGQISTLAQIRIDALTEGAYNASEAFGSLSLSVGGAIEAQLNLAAFAAGGGAELQAMAETIAREYEDGNISIGQMDELMGEVQTSVLGVQEELGLITTAEAQERAKEWGVAFDEGPKKSVNDIFELLAEMTNKKWTIDMEVNVSGGEGNGFSGGRRGGAGQDDVAIDYSSNQTGLDFEAGYAKGGRLPMKGLAEVGELGPEFVLDGVVIPASMTKRLKALGIGTSRGFALESGTGGGGGGGPRRRGDAGSGDAADVQRHLADPGRKRWQAGGGGGGSSLPAAGAVAQIAAETAGAIEELSRTIPAAVAAQQEALLMQQRQQLSQQLAQGAEQVQTLVEILTAIRDQGNVEDSAQAVSEAIEGVLG